MPKRNQIKINQADIDLINLAIKVIEVDKAKGKLEEVTIPGEEVMNTAWVEAAAYAALFAYKAYKAYKSGVFLENDKVLSVIERGLDFKPSISLGKLKQLRGELQERIGQQ